MALVASGCGNKTGASPAAGDADVVVSATAPLAAAASAADAGAPVDARAVIAPGDIMVIVPTLPKPGDTATVTFDADLDFDLNFGGLETLTSTHQSKKKKVEVLSVDPDGTIHKRVTYVKRDTNVVVDGEPRKDRPLVRGKTFLVDFRDTVVAVRRKNGAKATPEEVEAVMNEEGQFQSPEVLGRALGGIQLLKDQPFDIPAGALGKLVTGEYKPRRVVITYRGMEGDLARIDAEAQISNDEEALRMFVDLKGSLLVDKTGWCRELVVELQARAEFNGVVVGSGKGSGKVTATPLQ